MSFYTLLSILMFGVNFSLACFSYFLNPRSWLHRVFSLYLIAQTYQLFMFLGYSSSCSFEEACAWWRIDCTWPLHLGLFVPFTMIFVKRTGTWKSNVFLFCHFAFVLLLIILELTTDLITGPPVKSPWGWTYSLAYSSASSSWTLIDSLLGSLFSIWLGYIATISNYFLLKFYFSTKIAVEKKQTLLILLGVLLGVAIMFLQPALAILGLISPDSPNTMIQDLASPFCNFLFAYSIFKYGDNRFTQLNAANPLPVLMVGREGGISYINEPARELLGYSVRALLGTPLETILNSASGVLDTAPIESPVDIPSFEARIKINSGREVPVFVNGVKLSGKDSGSTMLVIKKKVS
jgi:PAS domain-containing protein